MRLLWVTLLLFILFAILSIVYPFIDIKISGLFFHHGSFYPNSTWWIAPFYYGIGYTIGILIVLLIGAYFSAFIARWMPFDVTLRAILFYILVLSIGAGVVVNLILKEHSGRARPVHIEQFNGDKAFSTAFIRADACAHNCSFSSGHVAAAFSLIAIAMLMRKKRALAWSVALGYGALVALARLAAGGHFFSDVVASFFIMLITSLLLYRLLFRQWYDVTL